MRAPQSSLRAETHPLRCQVSYTRVLHVATHNCHVIVNKKDMPSASPERGTVRRRLVALQRRTWGRVAMGQSMHDSRYLCHLSSYRSL